ELAVADGADALGLDALLLQRLGDAEGAVAGEVPVVLVAAGLRAGADGLGVGVAADEQLVAAGGGGVEDGGELRDRVAGAGLELGVAAGEGEVALELHRAALGVEVDEVGVLVGEAGQLIGELDRQRRAGADAADRVVVL